MTTAHTADWAPDAALRDGRIDARLVGVAESWLKDWFSEPGACSLGADLAFTTRRSNASDLRWSADGVTLQLPRRVASLLGAALTNYSGPTPRPDDDAILSTVATVALNELWIDICSVLRVAHPPSGPANDASASLEQAARFSFRFADSLYLELHVTRPRLATARKGMTAPLKRGRALGARREAVGRHKLGLEVMAGRARLELRELQSLAPGDVIVLDRAIGDELVLSHKGRALPHFRCRLDEAGAAQILVTSPIDQSVISEHASQP